MKFSLTISQAGVMELGLLDAVGLRELCLLDYLGGWFSCDKAIRVIVDGQEFRWVDYGHAIGELPLLFHPSASLRTHKNSLTALVRRLRAAGLVTTVSVRRRLHFRLTDKAAQLNFSRRAAVTKSRPIVTPGHDNTVTPSRDDTVTGNRDDSPASNNYETGIREEGIKEESADALPALLESFVKEWNLRPSLRPLVRLAGKRLKSLEARLTSDSFFAQHWRTGIERMASSPFCSGENDKGWRSGLDWFLKEGTLEKLLEGNYDENSTAGGPSRLLTGSIPQQIRNLDELIAAAAARLEETRDDSELHDYRQGLKGRRSTWMQTRLELRKQLAEQSVRAVAHAAKSSSPPPA